MRIFLAIASLALALTACSSTGATAPPAISLSASLPSTTASPTPPETTLTATESAYLLALNASMGDYLEPGEELDAGLYLEQGQEICGLTEDSEPPSLDAIIENVDVDGEVYENAIWYLCPKYVPLWKKAQGGFTDGVYTVGKDIKAGAYRTTPGRVTDCYWERSTGGGRTIANDFVSNAPKGVTVTVRKGEGFTSRDCGNWIRA